ncbi:hypothetical protein METBIDRAFT_44790 [Metschnikowia bicuspidata var. bicuspidata NRRL YB-4993]|uniref:Transcriptional activator HAP2 n=1 Tax=Metschnikowia bicuspidata var. bicuspidata NRRL YB-4993 TaxID=869754 RepID=A0A1A0H7X6_9ASCO|nr:hypothetical protein METBIDRAFT_44790 [Metschnikowia bicuspidata var. bicuspidata NRRL YB-4993]OBA20126.1 hypothetical protein METBIDRAFT_44790 [Metschnikowia bicuspidata var. bicuspidata NRRL YB-4993]
MTSLQNQQLDAYYNEQPLQTFYNSQQPHQMMQSHLDQNTRSPYYSNGSSTAYDPSTDTNPQNEFYAQEGLPDESTSNHQSQGHMPAVHHIPHPPPAEELIEQPFYVNAKQYHRILKRRIARAKLEETLKIARTRKPYLHESRHKHAMRRPRGQGGRFLTAAELAEQARSKKLSETENGHVSNGEIKSEGEFTSMSSNAPSANTTPNINTTTETDSVPRDDPIFQTLINSPN